LKNGETCGICGIRKGVYFCQGCHTKVCEACYDRETGLCISCASNPRRSAFILGLGFERILMIGMALIMLGIFLMGISSILRIGSSIGGSGGIGGEGSGVGSGGGIIIAIGPFPIVIGQNISPDIAVFVGILLTILTFGLIVLPLLRRLRKSHRASRTQPPFSSPSPSSSASSSASTSQSQSQSQFEFESKTKSKSKSHSQNQTGSHPHIQPSEPFIPIPEEGIEKEASRGLKDYLIALKLPNLDEGSISIQIQGRDLRIEAFSRTGERMAKVYRFPKEVYPSAYEYSYDRERALLIVRVSLVSSRAPQEA